MNKVSEKSSPIENVFYFAIGCAVFLAAIKAFVFYLSGSAAVMASLADSIIDVTISAILLMAVRYSFKPADDDHRYGHGKIEGVASLFQGAVMAAAGLFVVFESLSRFFNPVAVQHHFSAVTVLVVSVIISAIVMMAQNKALKKSSSFILEADKAHYKTDIFLNGSVIIALLVNYYNAPLLIDPLIAFGIACYFLMTAINIGRRSIDMLMDREVSQETRQHIEQLAKHHEGILGIHDLRTRDCGKHIHISFDVELNADLTLQTAHDIVRDLDHKIMNFYPNAEIIIHMDPEGDTEDPRHQISDGRRVGG